MSVILPPGALRLLLACIVVVSHYGYLSGSPLYSPIDGPAVVGFFFFSGYWVALLWRTKYSRCRPMLATFYLSRALRIYPLAVLATLTMAVVTPTDLSSLVWNMALFGLQFGSALNPPAWSLGTEVQFYAVAPLLFILVRYRTAFLLLLILGACTWVAFALKWTGTFLPTFILPFVLGAHYAQGPRYNWVIRLAVPSLVAFVLLGVVPNIVRPAFSLDAISRFVVILLSSVSLPYIAASLAKKSDQADRMLGDLAYPVYLFHWPMYLIVAKIFPNQGLAMAVTLTAAVSIAVLWLVDRPIETWRRRLVSRRVVDAEANCNMPNVPDIVRSLGLDGPAAGQTPRQPTS
jgi:peptidoglycan/LPS O-acetylase OafA/YrhL